MGSTPATNENDTASGTCARATVIPDRICALLRTSQPQRRLKKETGPLVCFQQVTSPTGTGKRVPMGRSSSGAAGGVSFTSFRMSSSSAVSMSRGELPLVSAPFSMVVIYIYIVLFRRWKMNGEQGSTMEPGPSFCILWGSGFSWIVSGGNAMMMGCER